MNKKPVLSIIDSIMIIFVKVCITVKYKNVIEDKDGRYPASPVAKGMNVR